MRRSIPTFMACLLLTAASAMAAGPFPITVQWASPSAMRWGVDSGFVAPTVTSSTVSLVSGTHSLYQTSGTVTASSTFTVLPDGTLDWDPSLDDFLSGRGTGTLVVSPFQVAVRWSPAPSVRWWVGTSVKFLAEDAEEVMGLLPGSHVLAQETYASIPAAHGFRIDALGRVQRDGTGAPFIAGILAGEGTSTLEVHPRTVTISWARKPWIAWSVGATAVPPYPDAIEVSARLLPGVVAISQDNRLTPRVEHLFRVDDMGQVRQEGAGAPFTSGFFSGEGTSRLTVTPFVVRVSWTRSATSLWRVSTKAPPLPFERREFDFHLLPGTWPMGTYLTPFTSMLPFHVDLQGRVQPAVDTTPFDSGVLSGQGTSTLVVRPYCVTMRASLPSGSGWNLQGTLRTVAFPVTTLSLLPSTMSLTHQPASGGPQTGSVTISPGGAISPNPLVLGAATFTFETPCVEPLERTLSWIGDTGSGLDLMTMPNGISGFFVTPDGTAFTNNDFEEAGQMVAVLRDGHVVDIAGGRAISDGGHAVAANRTHVFIAERRFSRSALDPDRWPPPGRLWFGVSRRPLADPNLAAPFAGGKSDEGSTLAKSFLVVNEVDSTVDGYVRGLWADDARLYVSDPAHSLLRVYDAVTMAPLASWPLDRPGPLFGDASGTLWVLQTASPTQPARMLRLDADGTELPQAIDFGADVVPTASCIDAQGRLLVTDAGPSQQVLVYDDIDTSPRLVGRLGESGGIHAPPQGRMGDWRFNVPVGVGSDAAGNLHVVSAGEGTRIECYAPDGDLLWRQMGLEFVDSASADPETDLVDAYTREEHFVLDPSRPPGHAWELAGTTLGRMQYPEDPRLFLGTAASQFHRIQGQPILFVSSRTSSWYLQVYRFDPDSSGELAIPAGLYSSRGPIPASAVRGGAAWPPNQPASGAFFWRDLDGDGSFDAAEYDGIPSDVGSTLAWHVDENGDLWTTYARSRFRRFGFQGFTAQGVPLWDFAHSDLFTAPAPFTEIYRAVYDATTDTMLLSGYTAALPEHPANFCGGIGVGRLLTRTDGWSLGNRVPSWQIELPWFFDGSCEGKPLDMAVAGNHVFIAENATQRIDVHELAGGSWLGWIEPTPEAGPIPYLDVVHGMSVRRAGNGEYLILNEEDFQGRILEMRWSPIRFDGVPADVTVDCGAIPPPASPSATSTCSGTVAVSLDVRREPGSCPQERREIRSWTATDDCGNFRVARQSITIEDTTPPQLDVPAPVTLECSSPGGVPTSDPAVQAFLADAIATDDCGTASWRHDVTPATLLPSGCRPGTTTVVTFTAVDECGNTRVATSSITVQDTTPPLLRRRADAASCPWPPSHARTALTRGDFAPAVVDTCAPGSVQWFIVGCTSDQPDEGRGDGSTVADCVVSADGTSVEVRSERQGGERAGRTYTVIGYAVDGCSNRGEDVVVGTVHVPHDQRGGAAGAGRR